MLAGATARVMRRHLVALAAFLVRLDSPALTLGVSAEGVNHQGAQAVQRRWDGVGQAGTYLLP
jgi:hypothetical protein